LQGGGKATRFRDQFEQIPGSVQSGKSFKAVATVMTTMNVELMSRQMSEPVSRLEALHHQQSCTDGIAKLAWLIPASKETASLLQGENLFSTNQVLRFQQAGKRGPDDPSRPYSGPLKHLEPLVGALPCSEEVHDKRKLRGNGMIQSRFKKEERKQSLKHERFPEITQNRQ
jgi:hypothetical protein